MSNASQADQNLGEFYKSNGGGLFAGIIAAVFSHLFSGVPIATAMIFVYGISLYRQHGWRQYCGLLSMLGAVVGYYAVYESFKLSESLIVSISLSVLFFGLYVFYTYWVARVATQARAKALAHKNTISIEKALTLPLNRTEDWLEPTFTIMREKKAAGEQPRMVFIRPAILFVASFLVMIYWTENRLLEAVAASVFLFQFVVGIKLARYYARLNKPTVDKVLERDLRPPILFLRSFKLDELPVSRINDGWRGMKDMFTVGEMTFEERIKETFDDIGPLIAIGRPGEDAAPLGAAREYTDDASWQQLVLERAGVAQLVIMELDATAGMEWEIENVSKQVGLQRIAIILPPGEDIYEKRAPAWYKRWASLRNRFNFLPEVFEDTVAILFAEDNHPILISSDVSSIQKQLEAVKKAWLENAPNMRPEEVKLIYEQALAEGEKNLGPEHPDVAILANNLGTVLLDMGDFDGAQAAFERALTIWEKDPVPEQPQVATVVNNLGLVLKARGDNDGAQLAYERALAIWKKAFGRKHPQVAMALNNLGLVHMNMGDYARAKKALKQALAIGKKTLGPEHPEVAKYINNLGMVFKDLGNDYKARKMFEQALAIWEKDPGPEHPEMAKCINNLGLVLRAQGDNEGAQLAYERALAIWEKTFGPEHPQVALVLNNLSIVYMNMGDYKEAKVALERALAINEAIYGPVHLEVARIVQNQGLLHHIQNDYAGAQLAYERALEILEDAFGPEHPQVATCIVNLGIVFKDLGKIAKSKSTLKRALAIWEQLLPPGHPNIILIKNVLKSLESQV